MPSAWRAHLYPFSLLIATAVCAPRAPDESSLVDGIRNFQLVNVTSRGPDARRAIRLDFRAFRRFFIVELYAIELQGGGGLLGSVDVFRLTDKADSLGNVHYYQGRVLNRLGVTTASGFYSVADRSFDGQVVDDDGDVYYVRPISEFTSLRNGTRANSVVYRNSDANLGDDSVVDLGAGDHLVPPSTSWPPAGPAPPINDTTTSTGESGCADSPN